MRDTIKEPTPSRSELWRQRLHQLGARARSALLFVTGVFATLVALLLYNVLIPGPQPLTSQQVSDTVAQALASATPLPPYSVGAYRAVQLSLVLIEIEGEDSQGEATGGLGSGVIIDDKGDILTSLHVVADASEIHLTFADGTQSAAQIIAADPEIDVAVLQPQQLPGLLVPAVLGNPGALRVGDEAFVVGNPFGLYGSMSAGVISGFDRSFQPKNGSQRLDGLIQIDAAVNPGNSGGPLINRYGQVVGIVTGLVNPTDDDVFIGISFAVPINVAGGAAGLPPY